MISAQQALARLKEGNRRFAAGLLRDRSGLAERREQLRGQQAPSAIILGCSDSRVPAELIFDQGLGELFVIRVAGNITGPSQIGSIEFAVTTFGTRLVVVLGHSRCGAIEEALKQAVETRGAGSASLESIIGLIRPVVQPLLDEGPGEDSDALTQRAVRANVRASVERMRHESDILAALERDDGLLIVGAEYSLDTGLVAFFDGVPEDH
ncbi:MAG TPA: carbonic anhydrase [Woeseiaceae bacterium]|jgi:carbonic anhydrase|nr:carbonic anhydrase [Woeseiaceae bacterium]